jgi:hypothetical protein
LKTRREALEHALEAATQATQVAPDRSSGAQDKRIAVSPTSQSLPAG